MDGHAPANQLRLSLPGVDRVKPERNLGAAKPPLARGETKLRPSQAQVTEPPYADPHVRWCGRGGAVRLPPIPIWSLWDRVRPLRAERLSRSRAAGAIVKVDSVIPEDNAGTASSSFLLNCVDEVVVLRCAVRAPQRTARQCHMSVCCQMPQKIQVGAIRMNCIQSCEFFIGSDRRHARVVFPKRKCTNAPWSRYADVRKRFRKLSR